MSASAGPVRIERRAGEDAVGLRALPGRRSFHHASHRPYILASSSSMHPARQLALLVVTLSACGTESAVGPPAIARPDELFMTVQSGHRQEGRVAGPDVSAELPGSIGVRLAVHRGLPKQFPAATAVFWRVIDEGCGAPTTAVSEIGGPGIVETRWIRGTRAEVECRMVIEGIAEGFTFGTDTVTAVFSPGPVSRTYDTGWSDVYSFPHTLPPNALQDRHGNALPYEIGPSEFFHTDFGSVGEVGARTLRLATSDEEDMDYAPPGVYTLFLRDEQFTDVAYLYIQVTTDRRMRWRATGLEFAPASGDAPGSGLGGPAM